MIKIPRKTDIYMFTMGEIKFYVKPLTQAQKIEMSGCTFIEKGETKHDLLKAQLLYLKYGLDKLEGVYYSDDEPFELKKDANGHLTEDCIDELSNLPQRSQMVTCMWQCLHGIPEDNQIINPMNGEVLDGVKIEVRSGGKS